MSQTSTKVRPKITVKHRKDDNTIRVYKSGRVVSEVSFIGTYIPDDLSKFQNRVKLLFMKTVSR